MMSGMGQILEATTDQRVPYEEDSDNGLILGDKYMPEELLAEILCYVDYQSLLSSQLVCKRWKTLMRSYVWRKKAEIMIGRSLKSVRNVPWDVFYAICKKKPFDRNLIKNHSGQNGLGKHWKILSQGGDHWKIESPPVGVPPLPPDEPMFAEHKVCFVTSYYKCSKQQTIDLAEEGLTSHLLDKIQPPIIVSEWYSCRWDCTANYECTVKLIGKKKQILDTFQFTTSIENDLQFQWHRISHTFENYGPGLEKIIFYHGGSDNLFWAGHYGSKMAGASVIVTLPEDHVAEDDESPCYRIKPVNEITETYESEVSASDEASDDQNESDE